MNKEIKAVTNEIDQIFRSVVTRDLFTPINIEFEKQIFFEKISNGKKYNPKLKYKNCDFSDIIETLKLLSKRLNIFKHEITKAYSLKINESIHFLELFKNRKSQDFSSELTQLYGIPSESVYKKALLILSSTEFGESLPKSLSADQVVDILNIKLAERGFLVWEATTMNSSSNMSVNSSLQKIIVNERAKFNEKQIDRLLVHEIDTHILRYENGRKQNFGIFTYGFPGYLSTEEGLALLAEYKSGLLSNNDLIKYAVRVVLSYQCAYKDFFDLYKTAKEHLSEELAFSTTLRIKRGLVDTSIMGGYTKDQVYLEGFLRLKNLVTKDIKRLYCGKIGLKDLDIINKIGVSYSDIKLPNWLSQ